MSGSRIEELLKSATGQSANVTSAQSRVEELLHTLIQNGGSGSGGGVSSEYVQAEIAKLVNNAPEAYDTLKEIADWIVEHGDSVDDLNDRIDSVDEKISQLPKSAGSDTTDVDLDIADQSGNVILRLQDGHIKTKEFDSSAITIQPSNASDADLDFSDPNGNIILRLKDGHVLTAHFNSKNIGVVDVKTFGAVGDGITDDTSALESAMEYGFENKIPVRFSEGTYLIRRPLTLRSYMEIYGEGDAIIKSKASATTRLTAELTENSEVMTVESVEGFAVGDAIAVSLGTTIDSAAARHCSVGIITAINSTNNTITFKSAYDSIKVGAVRTHEIGCYVSNCCAIFRSYGMLYDCDNVYIHNLTLDGNRQEGEWADWFAGAIHIDASRGSGTTEGIPYTYSQTNPTFRDLTILNAHFDGISDQGGGGATITNCIIRNPKMHGIHFGTGYVFATVSDCIISETQAGAAVFWCATVSNVVVSGNRISNCYKGCSDVEYANPAQKSVIIGNIFENITSYIFDFSANIPDPVGSISIIGNVFIGVNVTIANIIHRTRIAFSNNIVESFNIEPPALFNCDNSERLSFIGNITPSFNGTVINGTATDVINALNSWNQEV